MKPILIHGDRATGKTNLANKILSPFKGQTLQVNGALNATKIDQLRDDLSIITNAIYFDGCAVEDLPFIANLSTGIMLSNDDVISPVIIVTCATIPTDHPLYPFALQHLSVIRLKEMEYPIGGTFHQSGDQEVINAQRAGVNKLFGEIKKEAAEIQFRARIESKLNLILQALSERQKDSRAMPPDFQHKDY